MFCGIRRKNSTRSAQNLVNDMCSDTVLIKLLPHTPGANKAETCLRVGFKNYGQDLCFIIFRCGQQSIFSYISWWRHHMKTFSTLLDLCAGNSSVTDWVSSLVIFHAINGALRIQLTHFSFDDCKNTCTWSYPHHQIGSVTHLPLFMVKSWNNGVHCMYFFEFLCVYSLC